MVMNVKATGIPVAIKPRRTRKMKLRTNHHSIGYLHSSREKYNTN
jgi:hypothetical protein